MKKNNRFRQEILRLIQETGDIKSRRRRLSISTRIVIGLFFLVIVGTLLLWLPAMGSTGGLSLPEAAFTATSALTVTGLSTINASTDLSMLGQVVLLILIQFGGVGYMFVASLIIRLLGRKLFIIDRLALSSSIGLNTPEAILQILRRVFYGILIIEGIGTVLLYLHWSINDIVMERPVFMALFHSVSAFCNAGFDLFGDGAIYPAGIPKDNLSLLILGLLIFFGGLGIPVLSELVTFTKVRKHSLHTRITLLVIAILLSAGWLATFLGEMGTLGVLADRSLDQQLVQSWFHSISSRTAGFSGFADFSQIRPSTQLLTMVLMFIGCAPASMGGGITTGTFAVLGITLLNFVRGKEHIQVLNREISYQTVRRAASVLTISVGLIMLATFLILVSHPVDQIGMVLFEVISAFATCGLSLGFTAQLNGFGQVVIAIMMIWGRLGALTIVVAVAQSTQKPELLRYPEEQLLIG
ncbi:MAG: potassium transporter TrkG [Ardenticatenaceae bacterium]|nr:potassium transporter TrkG [Ardenticatenaceae bacterium]